MLTQNRGKGEFLLRFEIVRHDRPLRDNGWSNTNLRITIFASSRETGFSVTGSYILRIRPAVHWVIQTVPSTRTPSDGGLDGSR